MKTKRAARLAVLANILAHVLWAVALAMYLGLLMNNETNGDMSPTLVVTGTSRHSVFLVIACLSFFLARKRDSWFNTALMLINGLIAIYTLIVAYAWFSF